jgi:hypothetical protein
VLSFVNLCLPMVYPCTKVLQLHTNQLIVWFVHVHVKNWPAYHSSSSPSWSSNMPFFTPKVLWTKEHTPTPYPSIVFTFGFIIESMKEFGGVSFRNHQNFENSHTWHTICRHISFCENNVANSSYSMLLGRPWFKDAKVTHD